VLTTFEYLTLTLFFKFVIK